MTDPVRRALSIAVGSFEDSGRDLAYATDFADLLRTALTELGYECLSPPDVPSSESIDAAIKDAIEASGPDDVLLVHLITHAERAPKSKSVYVLGSDARLVAPLEEWVRSIEDQPGPLTLFLLDVCYAGEAARLPWQGDLADGSARAWVIGAATPRDAAYDGRLTRAVVNVIEALRRGELDLDATLRNAPFVTVARAIGQEVKRLVEEADGYTQQATGSLLDITAIPPELPFFPNLAPRAPSITQQARAEVDVAIRPFVDDVDEALDASHFFERAAGGPQVTTGCFSGRGKELRELVPWLQGYGDGPLRVVTGSPGAGKSAILGVMVCAAHTRLRAATAEVWKRVELAPWPIKHLAAVHARKRGPEEITASLARQLGLGPDDLAAGVATFDEIPVIVLDALDEADLADEVMRGLLLPLANAVREDGRPAVRLLVGTRRWGFEPLLDLARAANGLIDLDEVDRDVLYDEIETYVLELLRANPAYRGRGAVRGAFAAEVARSLSAPPRPEEERWGEFLVAGLYSRQFLSSPEITDPAKAADLGGRVPRTLPEVFALDFSDGSKGAEARSLLAAVAHAQGEGMPLALAVRAATAIGAPSLAIADRDRWDAARFYLRRATDVDGTMIYRIFHEGLAEHLREALPADSIYGALLSPLDSPQGRRWDLAEPYLLRHAPDHAHAAGVIGDLLGDIEFLIHCDASAMATIATIDPSYSGLVAELLAAGPSASPDERRRALALAAVRTGDAGLAGRLAVSPGGAPLPWRPVWAVRHGANAAASGEVSLRGRIAAHRGVVNTIAVTRLNGVSVAVTSGEDRTIRLWDLTTLAQLHVINLKEPVYDLGIGHDAARPVVFFCDMNGNLRGGDLTRSGFPHLPAAGVVRAVAVGERAGEFVAISGAKSGEVRLWRLRDGGFESSTLVGLPDAVESLALGTRPDGTMFAVTGGRRGSTFIHELRRRKPRPLVSVPDPVYAVATGVLDGRSVILTGGAGAQRLRLWDEATGEQLGLLEGRTNTVYEAAIGQAGDRVIAVTSDGDHPVRFWDLRTRTELAGPEEDHVSTLHAVALGEFDGELVAVTGSRDGSVFVWQLGGAGHPALAGTCRLDDGPVALISGETGTLSITDLRTGSVLSTLSVGERGTPVGVQQVVLAGRQLPLLHFADGSRALWDPSGRLVDVGEASGVVLPRPDSPTAVTVIRDGRLVRFTGGADGEVSYLSPDSPDSSRIGHHGDRVTAVTASRLVDRTVLYTAAGRTVRVWDVETLQLLDTVETPGEIRALRADRGGYLLVDTGTEVICFAHSSTTA